MERPQPGIDRLTVVLLAAVSLLAFVLRIWGTSERTLFWDEAYHVELVLLPSVGRMLETILANPPSDPLFALILRGWVHVAGTADAAVRLPSVVFGTALPLATAWLAREITGDRRTMVGAALLVAVAPYLVQYGQEASLYSLASLTTTLAIAAAWRWRSSGRFRHGALAVGLAVVGVYSHYVVPVALGLLALIGLPQWAGPRHISIRAASVAGAVVALSWAPWLVALVVAWLAADQPRASLAHAATPIELLGALSAYTSGSGALLDGMRLIQGAGIVLAGVLVGRAWSLGAADRLRGLRVTAVVSGALFLGPWAISALTGRWLFVAHLMLFLLPALAVAVAAGALLPGDSVSAQSRLRRTFSVAAGGLLLVVQLFGLAVDAVHPPHGADGVSVLADVLRDEAQPSDPVFVTPNELQIVIGRYWDGALVGLPDDVDLERLYPPFVHADWLRAAQQRVTQHSAGHAQAWLIYRNERDEGGQLLAWLAQRSTITLRARQPFAEIYLITLR